MMQDLLHATMTIVLFLCVSLLLSGLTARADDGPLVDTPNGQVLGLYKTHSGKPYEEFLGIPFGQPPVGPLRWQKTEPAEPWTGVLNATEYGPHCTQLIAYGYPFIGLNAANGEDCLYINVWVPNGVKANEGRKLPVMVFYYGGYFHFGTSQMYPGHGLAVHGDVIVVGFNYRVNVLGFLSTGDQECPGNYGLWDQQMALLWVRDNIASFNGDPDKVTIFGQSAGGASVSHNVISHHTNSLFHNAIAISGGATASFGVETRALDKAIILAQLAGCPAQNTQVMMECLREMDAHVLNFWGTLGMYMPGSTGQSLNWAPVVDRDFVRRSPHESFEVGVGKHINFITGSTIHDMAGFLLLNPLGHPLLGDQNNAARNNNSLWEYARGSFSWTSNGDDLFNEIIKMYPDLYSDDLLTRTLAATRSSTDGTFASPANFEAVRHSRDSDEESGRTYQYVFKYAQSFLHGYPSWVEGSHLDDIYSVLGDPFMNIYRLLYLRRPWLPADRQVSNKIMEYYSNFAYTGNPNEGPFRVAVEWDEFDPYNQRFMLQTSPNFEMRDFYDDNTVDFYRFWQDVFPNMVIPLPPPTFAPETVEPVSDTGSMISEEEILAAVGRVKEMMKRLILDEEDWAEQEKLIDGYVADRRLGSASP